MAARSQPNRMRQGVQITMWSMVVWAAGLVLLSFLSEHYADLALSAADEADIRDHLASLHAVHELGGFVQIAAIAATLLGLVSLWRGSEGSSARGPLALGLVATSICFASWLLLLGTDWAGLEVELETWSWITRVQLGASIAMWAGIGFALPRLGSGVIDLRLSAVAVALASWCFGLPLWQSFVRSPQARTDTGSPSATLFAIALIGAATLLAISGRRVLRADPNAPGHADWSHAARGLRLAAGSLVAQVIITSFSLCLAILLIVYGGGIVFLVPIAIASAVAAVGMLMAARSPSPAASTMAAAAGVCFALVLAFELQLLFDSQAIPDLELCCAAAQLLGILFLVGYLHRVAGEVGALDLESRAAGLHALVLLVVGGGSLLGHALSSGTMSLPVNWLLYVMLLLIAYLAGIAVLLTVARTAHRLSDRLEEHATAPAAIARIESKHE